MPAILNFILILISVLVFSISSQAEQTTMFSLKSSSFSEGKNIPTLYTCDGKDLSPQLSWSGAPQNTQAFVLICEDPDAPAGIWYHWVLYNVPSVVSELAEGSALPAGAALGKNSWGRVQYNGPCPPKSSSHRYYFRLYALDSQIHLSPGATSAAVLKAIEGHVLGKASLMGIFGH